MLRVGNAVLLLPIALRSLTPETFGLWTTFLAAANFLSILDLGFSSIVARGAGYFWAGASSLKAYGLGDEPVEAGAGPNMIGLAKLTRTVVRVYQATALAATVLLLAGGTFWIGSLVGVAERPVVVAAWIVFAAGVAFQFAGVGWGALLNGVGEVRRAFRILLVGQLINYAVSIAGLMLGGGLWALIAGNFLGGAWQHLASRAAFRRQLEPKAHRAASYDPEIVRVLLPMSWRMGVSNAAGFFTHSYNTLVSSQHLGLAASASFGLTQNCVFLICQTAQMWWTIKLPEVNQLRMHGDQAAIIAIFSQRWLLFVTTYLVGAVALLAFGDALLSRMGARVRLVETSAVALLLLFWFLEYHASLFVLLKWSQNENPFLPNIIVAGVVVLVCSPVLVPWLGYYGLILSLFLAQATYNHFRYIRSGMESVGLDLSSLARAIRLAPRRLWRTAVAE